MHVPILLKIPVVMTVVSDKRGFIIAPEYMPPPPKKNPQQQQHTRK